MRILRDMELAGVKLDTERLKGISERVKAEADDARARDLRAGRGGVHARLAPAAGGGPVRQARAVAQAARQDGYSTDARVLQAIRDEHRDHPQDRALARADQARPDLPRRAAAAGRRSQPPAHHLQPDGGDHGPAVLQQPQPAEHPDPHRARTGDPRLLRRRARAPARLRRLLTGRAPAARPYRRRGGAQGHLPPRRGRAHRDRLPGVRRRRPTQIDPGMRSKSKMINYGIVYGLSAYGMADRLGIRAVRGRRVHHALPGRLPRRRSGSSRRRSSRAPSTATSRRCSAAAVRSPSCARGAGSCASRASALRSTWSSRAPPPTS